MSLLVLKKILKKITSIPVLVFIAGLVLILTIQFWNDKIAYKGIKLLKGHEDKFNAIVLVVGVVLLIELFYLVRYLRNRIPRSKTEEKNEIKVDETTEELMAQRDYCEKVNSTINRFWRGKNFWLSKNYKYLVPWYIVIGKKDSGKTSILSNSNLFFPLEKEIRDVDKKGKHLINWMVTDESVFLDIGGELFNAEGDDDENITKYSVLWEDFLGWLLDTRGKRPLNGIILTIDIEDFIFMSDEARNKYSRHVFRQIRYINNKLGLRLPIYIMLTKFDLLEGFTEFFDCYKDAEREQCFGFSFPLEVNSSNYWVDSYEEQYENLIAKLNLNLARNIGDIEEASRDQYYSFVRQLIGLKALLRSFLDQVFHEDNYSTFPLVRGLFFSSVYQESVPINALEEGISRLYHLPEIVCAPRKGKSVPYFIHNFFDSIVFKEAGLVGYNYFEKRRIFSKHIKAFAMSGALVCLLTALWFYYFDLNRNATENVLDGVEKYTKSKKTTVRDADNYTGDIYLEQLNILKNALGEYKNYENRWPLFENLGLYKGHQIAPSVYKTYKEILSQGFLKNLNTGVLKKLEKQSLHDVSIYVNNQKEEVDNSNSSNSLALLRIVKLINELPSEADEDRERILRYRKDLVEPYMVNLWHKNFPGQKIKQTELFNHLHFSMENLSGNMDSEELAFFRKLQQQVANVPLEKRLYSHLKAKAMDLYPGYLDVRFKVGGTFNQVFQSSNPDVPLDIKIPKFYTYDGFHDYFIGEHEKLLELSAIDTWALESSANKMTDFSDADLENLKRGICELYASDYEKEWKSVLEKINLKKFNGQIASAVQILSNLKSNNNPYRSLIKLINKNTILFPYLVTENGVITKKEDGEVDPGETKLTKEIEVLQIDVGRKIESAFVGINNLISVDQKENETYLDDVELALANLYDYMNDINFNSSAEGSVYVLNKVIERLKLKSTEDPLTKLQRIADGLNEPFKGQMLQIVSESWDIILRLATEELDYLWKEEIYDFYVSKINGKYPINKLAHHDVSSRDFKSFFGKSGKLEKFYNKYLETLLEENKSQVYNPQKNIYLVSPSILKIIDHVRLIREAYLGDADEFQVEYTIQPLNLSGVYLSSILNIDGVPIVYKHGKISPKEMIWPNQLKNGNQSMITFRPINNQAMSQRIVEEGHWSWFRLLDQAQNNSVSDNVREFRFNASAGSASYVIRVQNPINPFTRDLFAKFYVPDSLKPMGHKSQAAMFSNQ